MKRVAILLVLVLVAPAGSLAGSSGPSNPRAVAIEGGFAYRDVEFTAAPPHEVLGTILNESGKTVQAACFLLKLYRQRDLIRIVDFCLEDFISGRSRIFRVETEVDPKKMTSFKIQFQGTP